MSTVQDRPVPLIVCDAVRPGEQKSTGAAVYGKVVEIAIPWEDLVLKTGDEVDFHVEILRNGDLIQRLPRDSAFSLAVPTAQFGAEDWTA